MRRSHSGVSDNWLPERWYDISSTGGGAMMDLGAHPVYILTYLFGSPVRVSGMGTRPFGTASDENAIALVEFSGGILATAETAFVTNGVPDILEVYGAEGSVYIHGEDVRVATKSMQQLGAASAQPIRFPAAKPSAINQFVDACVSGGESPEGLGLDDALVMTRLIEAFYKSDNANQTVILEG
jgi:predicted dehydrogenase